MSAEKRVLFDCLRPLGVYLHLDARRPGVVVPPQCRGDRQLVLQFGDECAPPIDDLDVSEEQIEATLSFGGKPYRVVIPWTAVYAIVDAVSRGVVTWREDLPDELVRAWTGERAAPARGPDRLLN